MFDQRDVTVLTLRFIDISGMAHFSIWMPDVEERLGKATVKLMLDCARNGDISDSQMSDIATNLGKNLDGPNRVFGNHKRRKERDPNAASDMMLKSILSDWYEYEFCDMPSGEALSKMVEIFRGPDIDLRSLADQLEAVQLEGAVGLSNDINDMLEQYPEIHSQVKTVFKCDSVSEALTKSEEVVQTALLATLAILLPDMREELQELTSTPLGETREDVNSYLEAVIKSGVATDAHREMLYVLGNTGTGKTSLTGTYKAFLEMPDKLPEAILTEGHPELLKTRIAEVHKDTILPQISSETLQTEEKDGVLLVRFKSDSVSNADHDGQEMDKCFLKIIDFGGHQVFGN